MGLGSLMSDIFGGKNSYKAALPPTMGLPPQKGESKEAYQRRVMDQYNQQMSPYTQMMQSGLNANLPQNVLDQSAANKTLGQNQALIGQLLAQGQGKGPNPALEQLKQTTQQNVRGAAAQAASSRGVNPALAMRSAANAGANANQQAAGQAALQSAEQQLAAQQAAGGLLGNQAGLQAQMASQQGQAGLGLMGARTGMFGAGAGAQNAYQNMMNNAYAQMNNVNAGVAAQNANTAGQYGQNAMSGIGSMLGMFSEGGEVPDWKNFVSDTKPEESEDSGLPLPGPLKKILPLVPLALSFLNNGGRAPANMATGGMADFYAFQGVNPQQALANQYLQNSEENQKKMSEAGSKIGGNLRGWLDAQSQTQNVEQMQKSGPSLGVDTSFGKPATSDQKWGLGGLLAQKQPTLGGGDRFGSVEDKSGFMERGQPIPPMSAGEKFNLGEAIGLENKLNPGLNLAIPVLSQGGKVKGKAETKGDAVKNDTVPAMLSPGEVVIPRTALDSEESAHKFLDDVLKKKTVRGYGDVLKAGKDAQMMAARVQHMAEGGCQLCGGGGVCRMCGGGCVGEHMCNGGAVQ